MLGMQVKIAVAKLLTEVSVFVSSGSQTQRFEGIYGIYRASRRWAHRPLRGRQALSLAHVVDGSDHSAGCCLLLYGYRTKSVDVVVSARVHLSSHPHRRPLDGRGPSQSAGRSGGGD